jgi:hypothetical protein
VHLCFQKRLAYLYNYILEPLVNINAHTRNLYEGTPIRVFPATNLQVVLVK